ncbi:hypothetical protein IFM89_013486 [Coptis chinensis]|uniref:Protein PAIR1 n=1 Tax=Coptis chinensis TaxID=261450 RepID=A0A835I9Y1_9MAGN|nr:hypothetical protein IFM89_013486 [Coptis chinensis]
MKLKINKACDLNSISVLPPQSRSRSNAIGFSGSDTSVFGRSQGASQIRSQQQSQQSFSQQTFSQLSQNSLDDVLINEQRSQERENSTKRISCLAPVAYTREESQMPVSRSSNNIVRRWNSAPLKIIDISEELEHRMGMVENSLNRFGMILDSVQGDVMQVNKAVKEVLLETESTRKQLAAQDSLLHLMVKGEEDIKAILDGSLKSIPDQLRKDLHQYKLQETVSALLSLPDKIEAQFLKMQNQLCGVVSKEMEAIVSSIKSPITKDMRPILPPQTRSSNIQFQKEQVQFRKNVNEPPKARTQRTLIPRIKIESPEIFKEKPASFAKRLNKAKHKQEEISLIELDREWRVIIDSDEEIDGGFSCLLGEKEKGIGGGLLDNAKGETDRILRKARRRKRKFLESKWKGSSTEASLTFTLRLKADGKVLNFLKLSKLKYKTCSISCPVYEILTQ